VNRIAAACVLAVAGAVLAIAGQPEVKFAVHRIDSPGGKQYGQTSLVDVDKDGDLDFISGDICTKPWNGDEHVFLENLTKTAK
jgi:hypothetical protein